MNSTKIFGLFLVGVFVLPLLFQACSVQATTAGGFTAKDKLPVFLSDVIGLDLTKYNKTEEGYGTRYEYDGQVEVEQYVLTLADANGGTISVGSEFTNGFPTWINVDAIAGSLYYTTQPSKDAIVDTRNILERYETFAKKYFINTLDVPLALDLLSKAPSTPSDSKDSTNFNEMSNFTPVNATSGNMTMGIVEYGIGFGYIVDGVKIPNKSLGINFANDQITFVDKWGIYSIGGFSVLSKDDATSMAWDLVKAYSEKLTFYQTGEDNVTKMVKPDWSQMTSDVGFTMIPGQQYNNSLNDDLLSQGTGVSMGNTTRAPLALYPFWSAIFYFSKPIDNIVGIQVGIWGDTKEVAYIDTYGYLGGSWQMSTSDGDAEQTPALISDDSGQTSPAIIQSSQLQTELIIGTVVAAIIVITATSIFVKKKRN
jgi:hypothetical protein